MFMKNKNISDLTTQYNNYIYPKPTENLYEEWIKKNRFQIEFVLVRKHNFGGNYFCQNYRIHL